MENVSILFQTDKSMRENNKHITRFELNISNPSLLTAEQQVELEVLSARSNSTIDFQTFRLQRMSVVYIVRSRK